MNDPSTPLTEDGEHSSGSEVAGAEDVRAALLDKLAQTRGATLALVRSLDDAARREPPSGGGWSVHQQLAHLAEMEPIWLSWALSISSDPGSEVGDEGPTPTPSVEVAAEMSFEELEARLSDARAATLGSVSLLTRQDLDQIGRHRWFGPMSVLQCLRAIYRHDRVHMDQMQGRETTFRFPPLPTSRE